MPVEDDCRLDLRRKTEAASYFTSQLNRQARRLPLSAWIVVWCCVFAAWAQASTGPSFQRGSFPDPTLGATYVGSDTCQGCHSDLYEKQFANTPHATLLKEGKHGCEDCHGPGSEHVAGGGDVTKIIRYEQLTAAQSSQLCMRCHQASTENSRFSQSMHMAQGVGCLNCHSPHKGAVSRSLLVKPQQQLCFGCHAQQKAEFMRPYRHRVDEGLIQCSDCHNPHGSANEHQLRTVDGGMQICTKCHTEKKGPFVFEHLVVKQDGCTACHTPHGSTNPRLLRVSEVNLLCLQCHTPIAGRATPPQAPSFHDQSAKYQACTLCHTQIHGSNFSDVFFR
jgi:DmsE family decaheme c-type cytochrome